MRYQIPKQLVEAVAEANDTDKKTAREQIIDEINYILDNKDAKTLEMEDMEDACRDLSIDFDYITELLELIAQHEEQNRK